MVHAFVMVKTGPGQSEGLHDDIRGLDIVREAHVVAGEFDLIVEVEGEEVYDVLHAVSSDLQSLRGVENTKTYISLD